MEPNIRWNHFLKYVGKKKSYVEMVSAFSRDGTTVDWHMGVSPACEPLILAVRRLLIYRLISASKHPASEPLVLADISLDINAGVTSLVIYERKR